MKYYLVMFYNKGKKIGCCYKQGENEDDAIMKAEFFLMAKYPNIVYDDVRIEK